MKNGVVLNVMLTAFGIIICSVLFPLSAMGSDTEDVSGDDVGELRLREDRAAREVNEAANAEIEQIKANKKRRYIDEELGYVPDVNLVSSDELATIERQREGKINSIRSRYGYDINSVKQEEAGATEGQIAEVQWKEQRQIVKPVVFGTVTGIVLYNNQGAVLVAGQIARENDTVQGIKVVRIMPDYVEFQRQGRTWKQAVAQPPPPAVWEPSAGPVKQAAPAQRPSTTTTKPAR